MTSKSRLYPNPCFQEKNNRSRIWWCCLGEFSFMPIHAAGIYDTEIPICLSDFFISSYTPSLGALIDAREHPIPTSVKILAVAQPMPGGGYSHIPQVKDELQVAIDAVSPEDLIYLGGSDKPDLEGIRTTVANVLEKLPEASVLHLACHGVQDVDDPLRSGFVLANGERLTIEDLMKLRLPNAHIAILNACHTSSNDPEQPNESLNLSSALMFLGFNSILATKWFGFILIFGDRLVDVFFLQADGGLRWTGCGKGCLQGLEPCVSGKFHDRIQCNRGLGEAERCSRRGAAGSN